MIGKRVRIDNMSRFYVGTRLNPTDILGTVESDSGIGNLPIRVNWDNGSSNVYKEEDLIFLSGSYTRYEDYIL